jgi:hypothetical protein
MLFTVFAGLLLVSHTDVHELSQKQYGCTPLQYENNILPFTDVHAPSL